MQRTRYFDKAGEEVSASRALRDGILQSGFSIRVPAFFKDAARFTDARQFWDRNKDTLICTDARGIGGSEGNKPGFRVLDAPVNRQAIADARAAYLDDLQSAWRADAAPDEGRRECPDCDGDGEIDGKQCPTCKGTGEIPDDDDTDEAAESQSDAKRRRRPEPDDDDSDPPPFGAQDRRTVDQIAHQHRLRTDRLLADHAQWLSEQWKTGK